MIYRPVEYTSPFTTYNANINAYWRFDNSYTDYKGNLTTNYGSTFVNSFCNFNSAVSFDGNDYITLGNNTAFKPTSFTISWWGKNWQNGSGVVLQNFKYTTNYFGFCAMNWTDGSIQGLRLITGNNGVQDGAIGSSIPLDDQWHHFAITFGSGIFKGYIDGIYIGSQSRTVGYVTTMTPHIGCRMDGGTRSDFYKGQIDDLILFNNVLTDEQIADIAGIEQLSATLGEYVGDNQKITVSSNQTCKTPLNLNLNGNPFPHSLNARGGIPFSTINYPNSGKIGLKAAEFTGTQYLRIYNDSSFNFTAGNDYAISLFFKYSSVGKTDPCLISTSQTSWGAGCFGISLSTSNSHKIVCYYTPDGTNTEILFGLNDLNDSKWHNVILTRIGSTTYLYVDGELNDSTTGTIIPGLGYSNLFIICRQYWNGTNSNFSGLLDQVIIEREGWSADRVKNHYTHSLGQFATI